MAGEIREGKATKKKQKCERIRKRKRKRFKQNKENFE